MVNKQENQLMGYFQIVKIGRGMQGKAIWQRLTEVCR